MMFASLAHLAEGGDCEMALVLQTDVKMAAPFGEPQHARVPPGTPRTVRMEAGRARHQAKQTDQRVFFGVGKERKNLL